MRCPKRSWDKLYRVQMQRIKVVVTCNGVAMMYSKYGDEWFFRH